MQYLWIQQEVDEGRIGVSKIPGTDNVADLMTKSLKREDNHKYLKDLGIHIQTGRSEYSLKLQRIVKSDFWAEGNEYKRMHLKSRNCLFTPLKIPGPPKLADDVGDLRVTTGMYKSGKDFVIRDLWKTAENPHRRIEEFTGETVFLEM